MTKDTLHTQAALALSISIAGLLGLVIFEVMRALAEESADLSGLPPIAMLVGVLSLTSVGALASAYARNGALIWVGFVIAVLLTLFHAMHVAEHVTIGDMELGALILFTMFAPCLVACLRLWASRKAE